MDHLQKFAHQLRNRQVLSLLVNNGLLVGIWWYCSEIQQIDSQLLPWVLISAAIVLSIVFGYISAYFFVKPLSIIWQAVMHVAPETANMPAPNPRATPVGRDMITSLVNHIYQLAHVVSGVEKTASKQEHNLKHEYVANSIPLPLVVLDKQLNIVFANKALADYIERDQKEITGQNIYTVLDLAFSSDDTLDSWLSQVQSSKPVDSHTWDRVRLTAGDDAQKKLFDLSGHYSQNNPDGYEVMLTLFDHTERYSQDDQGLSFVALAVHELRTPITLLRGYIEAFEEELNTQLTPELSDFMHKMKASAQQLTTFINNILNVARIENDQMTFKLHEEDWRNVVDAAISDIQLRASARQVAIEADMPDSLPTVGIDTVSMYEVLNNLLDNSIKYSKPGSKIIIKVTQTNDGLVQTTIQDFGIGIPANIVSNLFEKFYRSYHSKSKVGGTGLGLYLCKAIVQAHGGNIWVRSHEGQGSTFGFTIKPFTQVDEEQKTSDNKGIVRRAHGWIKNHSLYRG